MHVIVFLDDRGGMMFNNRRQSRDREAVADILTRAAGVLRMTPYTAKLFSDVPDRILVSEQPLSDAAEGDTCVIEQPPLLGAPIRRLTVYRWNEVYPADRRMDLSLDDWRLESTAELTGFSHERITREEWVK